MNGSYKLYWSLSQAIIICQAMIREIYVSKMVTTVFKNKYFNGKHETFCIIRLFFFLPHYLNK